MVSQTVQVVIIGLIATLVHLSPILSQEGTKPCLFKLDSQYGGTKSNCSSIGISRVPGNLPRNTTTLDLTFNHIEILRNNDFRNLTHLRYLDISFNPINTLEVWAFNGLASLLVLEVNGHELNYTNYSSIPSDVFSPLQSLITLSFRSNVSRFPNRDFDLRDGVFGPLKRLKHLNMDTSSGAIFKSGFANLTELQELVIGETWKHGKRIDCGLSVIRNNTFEIFASIPVQLVQLNSCRFESFDENFLRPFPSLKIFLFNNVDVGSSNLSQVINVLRVFEYKNITEIGLRSIKTLLPYIGFNRRIDLHVLSKICVNDLDVSDNSVNSVDFDVIFTYPKPRPPLSNCLKRLNIAKNRISGTVSKKAFPFFMLNVPNIEKVDLSDQRIFSFDKYVTRSRHRSHRHGNFDRDINIVGSQKLRYFNMGGLPHELGPLTVNVHVLETENLKYFNISYCGLSNLQHKITGLENLEVLDVSGNDLSIINDTIMDTFPNLTQLYISNSFITNDFIIQNGTRFLRPLEKLELLDISNNGLVILPKDIFKSRVTLKTINLSGNKLVAIPDLLLLVKLESVYLNHNSLTTIPRQNRHMLDKTTAVNTKLHLYMMGNTFICTCDSISFLLWLDETKVKLDGRNYSCLESTGQMTFTNAVYKRWPSFHRQCISSLLLNYTIGGLSITIISLITAFVFFKNKMKLMLILLRMVGQHIYPRKRGDFVYDAFIIYTDSISCWVCNQLRTELETNRGIELNLRDRDHIPGGSMADDLLEAMRHSWKIVLILTEDFLRSNLAYFTMCNCLSSITLTTPHRLIIIIDHQMNIPTNIDFLLEAVSEDNILYVNLQNGLTDEFWEKLAKNIKSKENVA
ncbi:toll-like receptor 4 isoform X2 [Patella vulgata]|nr:toll-like receptor 4 isoform X2 [Patella vulgata]